MKLQSANTFQSLRQGGRSLRPAPKCVRSRSTPYVGHGNCCLAVSARGLAPGACLVSNSTVGEPITSARLPVLVDEVARDNGAGGREAGG